MLLDLQQIDSCDVMRCDMINCLRACLRACVFARLLACLIDCGRAFIYDCARVCELACMDAIISRLFTCLTAYLSFCLTIFRCLLMPSLWPALFVLFHARLLWPLRVRPPPAFGRSMCSALGQTVTRLRLAASASLPLWTRSFWRLAALVAPALGHSYARPRWCLAAPVLGCIGFLQLWRSACSRVCCSCAFVYVCAH